MVTLLWLHPRFCLIHATQGSTTSPRRSLLKWANSLPHVKAVSQSASEHNNLKGPSLQRSLMPVEAETAPRDCTAAGTPPPIMASNCAVPTQIISHHSIELHCDPHFMFADTPHVVPSVGPGLGLRREGNMMFND